MIKKVELDLGGKVLSLETGRMANQAGGSIVIRLGDTMVMATATTSKNRRPGIDFFPLLVDFEEKLYAIGRIPGGFFKREGRPTETAILTARRIDRPIRPLFPKGFRNDVQLVITPLSVDQDNPPDILAINAASAALTISDAPFDGPIGAARIGRVDGEFIVDPTYDQVMNSDLDVVIAGIEDKISMIECGSDEVAETDVLEAIKLGQKKIKEVIKLQKELLKKTGEKKAEFKLYEPNEKISKYVKDKSGSRIEAAMGIEEKAKQMEEIDKIKEELESGMDEELKKLASESPADVKNVINDLQKKAVRKAILEKNKRPDGRKLDEVREIKCEVGVLPRAHGSALFSRGDTQVLTVATLGALGEEQRLEGLSPENSKRYMHHYNFPAFSVGEVRPLRGPGRREIGHGALAEKSLLPVVPNEEKFPYTIRLVSEVLSSNGSTSMASTCGSTLALMDCGVKISNPVAGISVGLVSEGNKEVMFTDIQGIEDFFGDMDFKVSGTKKGITGIQVDCKVKGLSIEIIEKALKQAQVARMSILEKMLAAIGAPREELSQYAPSVQSIKINPEKIGAVIGPGGKMIRKITEETDAKIDIEDDGTVLITATDPEGGKRALKMIEDLTFEPKVGSIFKARVVKIMAFGAFVQIAPGKEGLVHISEIAPRRINKVEDVLKLDDEVIVKLTEVDDKGRNNFSIRAVTPEDKEKLKEG
ncbi:MAG: polyribonucleotide nucleotidyltransferase [Candidatus Margulisiibacteriota bacterium]|nr:polyribonucleotide nucleotidyltransferase [Candidatus Margulisiibacteriota bacterium]